jgi:hypothetical protein
MITLARNDELGWRYEYKMAEGVTGRKFCATSKTYLGWVPPTAETGDIVYVVFGAKSHSFFENVGLFSTGLPESATSMVSWRAKPWTKVIWWNKDSELFDLSCKMVGVESSNAFPFQNSDRGKSSRPQVHSQ